MGLQGYQLSKKNYFPVVPQLQCIICHFVAESLLLSNVKNTISNFATQDQIEVVVTFGCVCSYNASLRSLPQQASEGDDWGHAGAVEEEEGGNTLKTQPIFVVTQIERSLPLNVQDQTPKQSTQERGRRSGRRGVPISIHHLMSSKLN